MYRLLTRAARNILILSRDRKGAVVRYEGRLGPNPQQPAKENNLPKMICVVIQTRQCLPKYGATCAPRNNAEQVRRGVQEEIFKLS